MPTDPKSFDTPTTGDAYLRLEPFWVRFPNFPLDWYPPRQGEQEHWEYYVWRPFWAGLEEAQKTIYLDHWRATPPWRETLAFVYGPKDPELDRLLGITTE